MIASRKHLSDLLKAPLKNLGFRKRELTWDRRGLDGVQVLNIQSSQSSDLYYVNLGVYLDALGDVKRPSLIRCHVRVRASQIDGVPSGFAAALNFNSPLSNQDREDSVLRTLLGPGVTWLDNASNLAALKRLLEEQKNIMVLREAHKLLGLDKGRLADDRS